jgi:hypothetical protein
MTQTIAPYLPRVFIQEGSTWDIPEGWIVRIVTVHTGLEERPDPETTYTFQTRGLVHVFAIQPNRTPSTFAVYVVRGFLATEDPMLYLVTEDDKRIEVT